MLKTIKTLLMSPPGSTNQTSYILIPNISTLNPLGLTLPRPISGYGSKRI